MNEREQLICRLKSLLETHKLKQRQYQEENNLGSEVGCISRESLIIASLLPQMQALKVSFEDCWENE